MYWLKDSPGNHLNAKNAPVSFIEDINVFRKSNPIVRDMNIPLREYVRKLIEFVGKTGTKVKEDMIEWGIDAPNSYRDFFSPNAEWLFKLCMEHQYNILIEKYGIDKMEGFLNYAECKRLWDESNIGKLGECIFNLPEGQGSKSNVLQYAKDTDGFHPTQKPVALIADLIRTYSNEGDTVLDTCMGSATTAVAAIRTGRNWIGYEMNTHFYKLAQKRIEHALISPTLF
jgi:site-specific DNA-methyltransferase (adenine-specific)